MMRRFSKVVIDAGHLDNHVIVFGDTNGLSVFINELRRPVVTKISCHPILVVSEQFRGLGKY